MFSKNHSQGAASLVCSLTAIALAWPLLCSLQTPPSAPAEDGKSPTTRPTVEVYEEILADYDQAYRDWRALPYEEREKFQIGGFLSRFRALADTGDGQAMLWVVRRHRSAEEVSFDRAKVLQGYIDRLLDQFSEEEWLSPLAMNQMLDETLALSAREANLKRWLALDEHESATTMLRFCLGMVLLEQGGEKKQAEALKMFDELVEDFPKNRWSIQAAGEAFKLRYLQVGMVAPDFETVDVDGVAFKLSDYRGKVVMLTFWGFW